MEKQNALLQSALWYLSEGFSVVPVKKDKTPLVKWQEYQHKRATEEEITSWWTQWPEANIAVVTGRISDLTVIDWDNKGEALPEGWEYDTPTVASGGGGKHWWFRYQEGVTNKTRFLPFFDIRSEGGYIIAPPSIHVSGTPYTWEKPFGPVERMRIPAALLKKMGEGEAKDKEFKKDWNKLLNEGPSQGSRNNDATAVCGKLLLRFSEPEWESEAWPLLQSWNHEKAKPPLSEGELKIIFESIAGKERKRRAKSKAFSEPTIARIGESHMVNILLSDASIAFEFTEFTIAPRVKEANMRCTLEKIGEDPKRYVSRINILSSSARETLVRSLKSLDKEIEWTLILSDVFERLEVHLSAESKPVTFSSIKEEESQFLLYPFLEDKAVNILFGQGGIGKTYLALKMACIAAFGGSFMEQKREFGCNVLFVDYESTAAIFRKRVLELSIDSEGNRPDATDYDLCMHYFDPRGVPLEDLCSVIRKNVDELGVGLVIVDSAVLACAGEPENAKVATAMMNALNRLGVCVLLIAHESKASMEERDVKAPFGSIYFYNSARNIWRVKGDKEPDENVSRFILEHKKSNNAKLVSPRPGKIYFGEGFVEINPEAGEVARAVWADHMPTKQRILNALEESGLTIDGLEEVTGLKRNIIIARLNDLRRLGKVRKDGDFWSTYPIQGVSGLDEAKSVFGK